MKHSHTHRTRISVGPLVFCDSVLNWKPSSVLIDGCWSARCQFPTEKVSLCVIQCHCPLSYNSKTCDKSKISEDQCNWGRVGDTEKTLCHRSLLISCHYNINLTTLHTPPSIHKQISTFFKQLFPFCESWRWMSLEVYITKDYSQYCTVLLFISYGSLKSQPPEKRK